MQQAKAPNKTICIIQLTRIGDLIQTLQAAKELKRHHDDTSLTLVARKEFASGLRFILETVFDKIYLLDSKEILADREGLEESRSRLQKFVDEINSDNCAVSVNLSFSKTSSYLSALIKAEHKLGITQDEFAEIAIADSWSKLVYSSVMTGPLNPFSLVDVYRKILGVKQEVPRQMPLKRDSKFITIHPFASLKRKHWKMEKWVEVLFKVLKDNPEINVNIVGAKEDIENSLTITNNPLLQSFKNRVHSYVGKSSIKETAKVLENSRLFVGHDSMVGHLASAMNTQSLTISLGSVRPIETSPWSANNYVIAPKTSCFPCFPTDKCEHFHCHADIPYQVVNFAIKELLEKSEISSESINKSVSPFHLNGVNVMRSSFTEAGLFNLTPLVDQPSTLHESMQTFYRILWLYVMDQTEEHASFPKLSQNSHKDLLRYLSGLRHLFELAEFGMRYSKFIISELGKESPDINLIKENSTKIDEIDHLQRMLKNSHPGLTPIIDYYSFQRGCLKGDNIVELSEGSYFAYHELSNSVSVMYELIEKTITEHKVKNNIQTVEERVD